MQLNERIGRRLKLQDLNVFITVVQAGSMLRAAERLNTGQPNISRSITELEHAVGVRLLDRHPRGVEPTAYGRALLDGGGVVFDGLRQAVKNIEFLADPTAGEVRVGCTPLLASSFVSAVIDRFSQRHPRIMFSLTTGYVETLNRQLRDRNVDLLVTRRFGPLTADDRLAFELLFEDLSVVATGARSPWVRRRKVTLADVANEPWVLPPPESGVGSIATEAFRLSKVDYPRTTVVTDSPHSRMALLATGRFLTIFPASALRFPISQEIKVLPIKLPTARVAHGIVTLKNRTLSPVAQIFIEHAREVARLLAKQK
jgi:DNA-binding transcriptional LysR family regulator